MGARINSDRFWRGSKIKPRSIVVAIFPNQASVLRLVGAILLEQDDESAVAEHRYSSAGSMKQLTAPEPLDDHARDPGNDCVGVTEFRNGAPEFHQLTGHFPNTSASVGRGRELITRDPIGTASLTRSCPCRIWHTEQSDPPIDQARHLGGRLTTRVLKSFPLASKTRSAMPSTSRSEGRST